MINVAVIPEPWWAWTCVRWNRAPSSPARASDGLYRTRVTARRGAAPTTGEAWWSVHDPASATVCAEDAIEQLEGTVVPRLRALLDRDAFVETVRGGDLGMFRRENGFGPFFDSALAVLLTDGGSAEELSTLVGRIEDRVLTTWVEARVAGR